MGGSRINIVIQTCDSSELASDVAVGKGKGMKEVEGGMGGVGIEVLVLLLSSSSSSSPKEERAASTISAACFNLLSNDAVLCCVVSIDLLTVVSTDSTLAYSVFKELRCAANSAINLATPSGSLKLL